MTSHQADKQGAAALRENSETATHKTKEKSTITQNCRQRLNTNTNLNKTL
jgi:hypothetical protein